MSALTRELFIASVEAELRRVLNFIAEQVKDEFKKQGHTLTGALEENIRIEIHKLNSRVIGELWINDYYKYVDQGVPSERIPYSGPGGGGTSKYIEALYEYAKIRMGVSEDDALGVAFAIANTHKKEGMPTHASGAFSSTGNRTGFFTSTLKDNEAAVDVGFASVFQSAVDATIAIFNSRVSGNVRIWL